MKGLILMVTTQAPAKPASLKQLGYLNSLRADRGYAPIHPDDWTGMSTRQASQAIEAMKARPMVQLGQKLEPGVYRRGSDVYKVYPARSSDRLLAKVLVRAGEETDGEGDWHFVYAGLAARFVKPADRMTLEQAKEFGAAFGICCSCGALLTDEGSIAAGIGPVCATKF